MLLSICRRLYNSGDVSRKEYDFLKDLIFNREADLMEVAAAIELPEQIDSDDLKGICKYLKSKLSYHWKDLLGRLFRNVSLDTAYEIANSASSLLGVEDQSAYTYGEVDFESFAEVLRVAHLNPGTATHFRKFVDLGHGSGRAIFTVRIIPKHSFLFVMCMTRLP